MVPAVTESSHVFDRWQHDVRNQLAIVIGFSDLLLQDAGEQPLCRAELEEIRSAAARAMQLIVRAPRSRDGRD